MQQLLLFDIYELKCVNICQHASDHCSYENIHGVWQSADTHRRNTADSKMAIFARLLNKIDIIHDGKLVLRASRCFLLRKSDRACSVKHAVEPEGQKTSRLGFAFRYV